MSAALSLSPLLGAAAPIPSHALVAFALVGLGAWQFAAPKGTRRHRIVGWLYVLGMGYVALSALFISTLGTWGYFSPIHLLIPLTLWTLYATLRDARRGRIRAHARAMVSLFVFALVITGAFTFLPGRLMHETAFGPPTYGEMR